MLPRFHLRAAVRSAKPLVCVRSRAASFTLGWFLAGLLVGAVGDRIQAQGNAAPSLYSQGEPSNEEQYLLQKLNRARLDPAGEGQRLAAWLRNTSEGRAVVSQYGTNPDQVASDLAAFPAVSPLAFDASLLSAAQAHSDDLTAHNNVPANGDAHAGYDGSTAYSRDQEAGYAGNCVGENVSLGGATNLDAIHAGLLVDWGNPGLGHRRTRLGSGGVNVIGIGLSVGSSGVGTAETEDFGAPTPTVVNGNLSLPNTAALVTGVVYRDANGNGQYDVGEGVAGATVTMDGGNFYTVTSASGGYALPLVHADGSPADGSVSVHVKYPDGTTANKVVAIKVSTTASLGSFRNNVLWEVTGGGNALPAFFDGANSLAQGWSYLAFPNGSYFGYYNADQYPYVLHNDMGWTYVQDANDGQAGVYLYDFATAAWRYTSPTYGFPYLYDFNLGTVLYYYPKDGQPGFYSSAPRYFFDFATGQILAL